MIGEDENDGIGLTQKAWYSNEEFMRQCPGSRDTATYGGDRWELYETTQEGNKFKASWWRDLRNYDQFVPDWKLGETAQFALSGGFDDGDVADNQHGMYNIVAWATDFALITAYTGASFGVVAASSAAFGLLMM